MGPPRTSPPGGSPAGADGRRTPSRRRIWWLVAAVALVVGVCVAIGIVAFNDMVGPGLGDITAAADALAVPNDMTLVHESSTGNRLCLEECVQMERIYTSRSPHRTTFQVFAGVLSRSGYRCQSWCTEFDEYGSRFSTWTGPGGRTINLVVHPTTGAWADSDLEGIHIDPDSQSYAQLFVS